MFFFNSAARLGKNDGSNNYPNQERGTASFTIFDDVTEFYDQSGDNGRGITASADRGRTITLGLTEITMMKVAEGKINKLVEKLDNKKEKLESSLVSVEMELSRDKEEYHYLRDQFFKNGLKRPNRLIKSFGIYLFLMFILVLFEWYFNYDSLFQSMGGSIPIGKLMLEPALVASGLALSLMIIAHFIGIKLRQWQKSWQWKSYAMSLLGIISIGLMLYALTGIRHINNKEASVATEMSLDIVDETEVTSTPETKAESESPVDNKEMYYGMFTLLFIIAAISLSYFSHDPDPVLEHVYDREIQLHKKIVKLLKKRMNLTREHDRLYKIFKQKIERLQNQTLTLISEYRDYNCKYRTSPYPANSDISLKYFKSHDLGHELDLTDPLMLIKMKKVLEDVPQSIYPQNNENEQ